MDTGILDIGNWPGTLNLLGTDCLQMAGIVFPGRPEILEIGGNTCHYC